MKFKSLYIQNFRALEDFQVKKLGHLNLIVGKNNSGKSTVLEALKIYAGNANRSLLIRIADDHDEKYSLGDIEQRSDEDNIRPFESFFTGRCFPNDERKAIVIGESEKSSESLWLQHVYLIKTEETRTDNKGETSTKVITRVIQKSELSKHIGEGISQAIRVMKNDKVSLIGLADSYRHRRFMNSSFENQENFPCSYIPTQFVSLDELADEWDRITLTGYEEYLKIALKFIEDDFENIAFIKNDKRDEDSFYARGLRRFAKVKMANMKQPVPLNSMGDGMLRVLQLALKIFSAKGGFLLIDEFENGLHFSVQEKVWDWLFDLAKRFEIQVFATTHSWDCVESFAKVALRKEDTEGMLFRVGRSVRTHDKGKVIATEFDKEKLATITQADVEVR